MIEQIEKAWQYSVEQVADQLRTDLSSGLDNREVRRRLTHFGYNTFEIKKKDSVLKLFFRQFASPLVAILAVAALLAFSFQEWLEGIAIVVVIILNALIGFFMEWQSIKSMDALRQLSTIKSLVIRRGKLVEVLSSNLVPGDLLYLEAGDRVPADCRITEQTNLGVDESALTGESMQVSKRIDVIANEVPLADQTNLLFKGTTVTRGNARAVIISTGKRTEIGKIYELAEHAAAKSTPLEKKLDALTRNLIWLTLLLIIIILITGIIQGRDTYMMVKTGVALGIAAIPEGLPIVATIALARGMLRLAKHQVIVKKLSAVETLAETAVIFTDKTGTLTENKLTADHLVFEFGETPIFFENGMLKFQDASSAYMLDTVAFEKLQKIGTLCNNAVINHEGSEENQIGDPLEIALLQVAQGAGNHIGNIRAMYPRLKEIPFSSESKMMGTLHQNGKRSDFLVCVKGALEVVLNKSDFILTRDGKVALENRTIWLEKADELAAKGLRILGLAYSEIEKPEGNFSEQLIFVGFIGFLDPPRTEVSGAIQKCKDAGIKVVMVTGDHPETARNIAHRIGLTDGQPSMAIHGNQIGAVNQLNKHDENKILGANIFARVSPVQKLDLVSIYQSNGYTVGMTGDGINDMPALKKADIGIAMGQRGTQAAMEVADLVLKDDAFTSIVVAVQQGRGIFQNIRYFVVYLLSCNLSEIIVVSVAALGNIGIPLLPLQILFLNMVTDVFPALALGMNREAENIMKQPPRKSGEPIISRNFWQAIVIYALSIAIPVIGVLVFSVYYLKTTPIMANNLTFYTLILSQLVHVFNLPKVNQSFIFNEITRNIHIWLAILTCLVITFLAYQIPLIREILNLEPVDWSLIWIVVPFSLFPILFIQLLKRLRLVL